MGRKVAAKEKIRDVMDITSEGYQGLMNELTSLRDERVTVAQDIRLAAADKDFRENAPLDAARERQGHLEARIRELEDGLQRAHIVDTDSQDSASPTERRVKLGSRVRLLDPLSKEKMVYTLVNASEASPMDFKMSTLLACRQGADGPQGRGRGGGCHAQGQPALSHRGSGLSNTRFPRWQQLSYHHFQAGDAGPTGPLSRLTGVAVHPEEPLRPSRHDGISGINRWDNGRRQA